MAPQPGAALNSTRGPPHHHPHALKVYAIGCPWALDASMSAGIVSGLGREICGGLFPIKNVMCALRARHARFAVFEGSSLCGSHDV